jgi:hypothetical protein
VRFSSLLIRSMRFLLLISSFSFPGNLFLFLNFFSIRMIIFTCLCSCNLALKTVNLLTRILMIFALAIDNAFLFLGLLFFSFFTLLLLHHLNLLSFHLLCFFWILLSKYYHLVVILLSPLFSLNLERLFFLLSHQFPFRRSYFSYLRTNFYIVLFSNLLLYNFIVEEKTRNRGSGLVFVFYSFRNNFFFLVRGMMTMTRTMLIFLRFALNFFGNLFMLIFFIFFSWSDQWRNGLYL